MSAQNTILGTVGCIGGGIAIAILVPVLLVISCAVGWIGEGSRVARKELGPEALLKKYELFKDQAATLEAKLASIKVADSRRKSMEDQYKDVKRKDWARTDAEQHSLWTSEVSGMKASYNDLAAKYNAEMAKENYKFANIGELPAGAKNPLPREFKPYVEE